MVGHGDKSGLGPRRLWHSLRRTALQGPKTRKSPLREGGDFQKGGEEHMKKLVYLACKLIIHPARGGVNRKL